MASEDKTNFTTRGFTWIENKGQSIRLIDRHQPANAITIQREDLKALRELTALALKDAAADATCPDCDSGRVQVGCSMCGDGN
jgi:hypothetical protein